MAPMPEESRNVSPDRSKTTWRRPSTWAVAVRRKRSISAMSNSPDSHSTPSRSHRMWSGCVSFFTVYGSPVSAGAATLGQEIPVRPSGIRHNGQERQKSRQAGSVDVDRQETEVLRICFDDLDLSLRSVPLA